MTDAVIAMNDAKRERGIVGGRFSTITPAVIAKASRYIEVDYKKDGSIIPTVEGLAQYINVHRSTLYESKELSDTLEQIQTLQARLVLNGALANEYNPSIAKLILSAKHGYIERSSVENTHEMVSPQAPQVAEDFQAYVNAKTLITDGTKAQD
jgi:hypothetical protein